MVSKSVLRQGIDIEDSQIQDKGEAHVPKNVVIATQNQLDSIINIEIRNLLKTLSYNVVEVFYQNPSKYNPQYFLGKGKVDEISEFIHNNPIDLLVIGHELKPVQLFKLARHINVDIFDRVRLILEIFLRNANSREAKLQVELAKLRYEIPLVKESIHRLKTGEHPGYRTGGKQMVVQYHDQIESRIKNIRKDLEKIKTVRDQRRNNRRKKGYFQVSIAGYTNAGKTTILNLLTGSAEMVEEKYFSTLSTRTRRLIQSDMPIILTDTIGFIQNLPPYMIKAFRSTIEEILESDVILLVVDVSESFLTIQNKISTSMEIIYREDSSPGIIIILNKSDLLINEELENKRNLLHEYLEHNQWHILGQVSISAGKGKGFDDIIDVIRNGVSGYNRYRIDLTGYENQNIEHTIHSRFEVMNIEEIYFQDEYKRSFTVYGRDTDISRIIKEYPYIKICELKHSIQ